MKLPVINDFDYWQKKVLVRGDFDTPLEDGKIKDNSRIRQCLPTIKYLLEKKALIILAGHLGRPEGKVVKEFKLGVVAEEIVSLLGFGPVVETKISDFDGYELGPNLLLLENLRFFSGEEENSLEFTKKLSFLADFYVNEAFSVSHRKHASIVGLPAKLPSAAGFHFKKEVEKLSKAIENQQRPAVFIIGGAKPETKMPFVYKFAEKADFVLVGGTLAEVRVRPTDSAGRDGVRENIIFADLREDGLDITEKSATKFSEIISGAKTIVWNGPMGKYEEPGSEKGTREIAKAVANSLAYKIVGGGDTIAGLTKFKLVDKMDYISTAGGAMLEFLAKGTLPGIEALKSKR